MTLDETKKCLAMIQETYPHFMDGRTMKATCDIWVRLFPEPYAVIEAAILAYFTSDNKGFPPVPGQIKEKIAQMRDTEPDEMQAWSMVSKALCRASRAEFAKFPPLIQQCIGSPETFIEWSYEDTGAVDTVIAAGFMRTYKARAQKQREYDKLPDFAKPAFVAIAPSEPYRLPEPVPKIEPVDDRVPVPDSVREQMEKLRSTLPKEEKPEGTLKEQAARLMKELKGDIVSE